VNNPSLSRHGWTMLGNGLEVGPCRAAMFYIFLLQKIKGNVLCLKLRCVCDLGSLVFGRRQAAVIHWTSPFIFRGERGASKRPRRTLQYRTSWLYPNSGNSAIRRATLSPTPWVRRLRVLSTPMTWSKQLLRNYEESHNSEYENRALNYPMVASHEKQGRS
jgi:hypothetical protein